MIFIKILALFLCGTFFGAAVYISIAQHPAAIKTGVPFAAKFFPPMYNLAAPMQIFSAVGGSLAGLIEWYLLSDPLWAIGAAFLVFVIPFTLLILKPINDKLLDPNLKISDSEAEVLLLKWAPRHWVRSIASGLAFIIYIWAGVNN